MSLLKNKNIVIIGGTSGIGLSAAKAFAANGANIVVVGRNAESVAEAKKILCRAEAISADATNPDTAINAVDYCIEKFGGFDGLYHVAGGSGRKMGDAALHERQDQDRLRCAFWFPTTMAFTLPAWWWRKRSPAASATMSG